jgi:hypothetical protein
MNKKLHIILLIATAISLLIAVYQFIIDETLFGSMSILYAMVFLVGAILNKKKIARENAKRK